MLLQMMIDPGEKCLDMRFAVRETMKLFCFSGKPEGFDILFDWT